jgi:hypothetical protein
LGDPTVRPAGLTQTSHEFFIFIPKLVFTWDEVEVTLTRMVEAHPTPCYGRHLTRGA